MNTTTYNTSRSMETIHKYINTFLEEDTYFNTVSLIKEMIQLKVDSGNGHLKLNGLLEDWVREDLKKDGYEVAQFQTYVEISR